MFTTEHPLHTTQVLVEPLFTSRRLCPAGHFDSVWPRTIVLGFPTQFFAQFPTPFKKSNAACLR